jgi:uncharacterized coiled-coil DUF342 family protein
MTDETLKQNNDAVLQAIAELSKKLDDVNSRLNAHDAQFEAIREGIEFNNVLSERMQGDIHHLRADVREVSIEMRKDKLALK